MDFKDIGPVWGGKKQKITARGEESAFSLVMLGKIFNSVLDESWEAAGIDMVF